jgi:hypothetical protein
MAPAKKKLDISCTATDCGSGLHCFRATTKMVNQNNAGVCRKCGIKLINWERIHSRNLRDVKNTFAMLKLEKVRHDFWHVPICQHAINHAKRKGRHGLRGPIKKHLSTAIGPAQPWHDGRQTPMISDAPSAVPYAQHATATCCRKCLEYWHGIPQGQPLADQDLDYLTELVCLYIEDRVPDLTEDGEKIPPIRNKD